VSLSSTPKPEAVSPSETLTAIYIYLLTPSHKPENNKLYNGTRLSGLRLWAISTEMGISAAGSEVLTAVFWDITPCTSSVLEANWYFGGTYRLHLQGWRISRAMFASCFHGGFLLGLFSGSEHDGDIFLRNVGWLSSDYTALYPSR
jgi:hypothetical protein